MLIGIVGFIGSGKGTVGDYLCEKWGFEKDSFANPLKDCVSIIFRWDRKLLEGDTDESREFRERIDKNWSEIIGRQLTPRLALQLFGTECIRNVFSENVWSSSLIMRYNENNRKPTVVTDCRFRNEIFAIKKASGYIIRISRGREPDWYEMMRRYNSGEMYIEEEMKVNDLIREGKIPHVSETNWIGCKFDRTIINNGSVNDLYEVVDDIMEDIKIKGGLKK